MLLKHKLAIFLRAQYKQPPGLVGGNEKANIVGHQPWAEATRNPGRYASGFLTLAKKLLFAALQIQFLWPLLYKQVALITNIEHIRENNSARIVECYQGAVFDKIAV